MSYVQDRERPWVVCGFPNLISDSCCSSLSLSQLTGARKQKKCIGWEVFGRAQLSGCIKTKPPVMYSGNLRMHVGVTNIVVTRRVGYLSNQLIYFLGTRATAGLAKVCPPEYQQVHVFQGTCLISLRSKSNYFHRRSADGYEKMQTKTEDTSKLYLYLDSLKSSRTFLVSNDGFRASRKRMHKTNKENSRF